MYLQALILVLLVLAAVAAALWVRRWQARRRWKMLSVKGEFTTEHHLPEMLPVPVAEETRVAGGEFTFDEAVAWMKQFIAERPRHALARQFQLAVRKADYYRELIDRMGRGRWNEVDEIATRLGELDPLDPSAALARGRAMREMGRLSSAVQFYQQALKLQPTHSLALPEFAATCRAIRQPHRFHEALEVARRQLGETHPLTIESRVQLGELVRVFADPTDPATIAHIPREQYLNNMRMRLDAMDLHLGGAVPLGRSMLEEDMPELAELVLERLEATYGEAGELQTLRGMIQHHERELGPAEATLRQAVAEEDSPEARLELARVLLAQAQARRPERERQQYREEAAQELRLAVDRGPNNIEAIALLAEAHQADQLDAVVETVEPLARAYPQAWAPWKAMGDAYAAEKQWDDAARAYRLGLSRERTDELLLALLGVLAEQEQQQEMLELVQEITDLDERDPVLRWRAAQVYCEARRFGDGRQVLEGLVRDEGAPPVLRQRAREVLDQLDSAPEGALPE